MEDIVRNVFALGSSFIFICLLGYIILVIVPTWIIYRKAGRPGWAAIIPIYTSIVQLQVAKMNPWLILIYLLAPIPIFGWALCVALNVLTTVRTGDAFNKSNGFILGMIICPFIFNLILAFGGSEYDSEEDDNDDVIVPKTPQVSDAPTAELLMKVKSASVAQLEDAVANEDVYEAGYVAAAKKELCIRNIGKHTDEELLEMVRQPQFYSRESLAAAAMLLYQRRVEAYINGFRTLPLEQLQIIVTNPSGYYEADVKAATEELRRRLDSNA